MASYLLGLHRDGVGKVSTMLCRCATTHAQAYTVKYAVEAVEGFLHFWRLQDSATQVAHWLTMVVTAGAQINDSHS